jgi:opacity protein-like surface antigen
VSRHVIAAVAAGGGGSSRWPDRREDVSKRLIAAAAGDLDETPRWRDRRDGVSRRVIAAVAAGGGGASGWQARRDHGSRRLIAAAAVMVAVGFARVAYAQPAPDPSSPAPASSPAVDPGSPAAAAPMFGPAVAAPSAPPAASGDDDMGDQAISAQLGLAGGGGGGVTPGGLRIAGHYLYQLSDEDWFDGAASFTFGSGGAACFRDRMDAVVCQHGVADGTGVEVSASVRRMLAPQGAFRPFARLGVGLGLVRFGGDDVSGITVPAHAGGGVRVKVAPSIAVVAEGELTLGFGSFNRGLGSEIQFGLAVTAGAEFRLR